MVLILYDFFPPAFKAGGPIQSIFNLAKELNKELQINVISTNKDADGSLLNVPENTWTEYSGVRVFYGTKGYKNYRQYLKTCGVLFINGIYSLQYNLLPIIFYRGRKIISVRGMLHPEAIEQKWLKKTVYLLFLKLMKFSADWEFHATNEDEKTYIERVFGKKAKVWVIPNIPAIPSWRRMPPKPGRRLIMSTVALISPMKNHHRILDALKNCAEQIVYNIYGPVKDPLYWMKCKRIIADLPSNISVNYCGEIQPELVNEIIGQSHIYIQPSLSENFGHSLFQALAIGRPIITSTNTPWQELAKHQAGFNIREGDQAAMLKAFSIFAEMAEGELADWSYSARDFALNKISIEKIKEQYITMFQN